MSAQATQRSLEPRLHPRPAQQWREVPRTDGDRRLRSGAFAVEVGLSLSGEHVAEVLNRLVRRRGAPMYLFADNGAEFTGHLVDMWAYRHGTRVDFSRPGKATDNAFIETFNGRGATNV